MGFKYWVQGLIIISVFWVIIAIPCVIVAIWGSKMINDLGNFPTKSVQILMSAGWKIFLAEIVSFVLLIGLYIFLYNLQNT